MLCGSVCTAHSPGCILLDFCFSSVAELLTWLILRVTVYLDPHVRALLRQSLAGGAGMMLCAS